MFGKKAKDSVVVKKRGGFKKKLIMFLIFVALLALSVVCVMFAYKDLKAISSQQTELGTEFFTQYTRAEMKFDVSLAMVWGVFMLGLCKLVYNKQSFGGFTKKIIIGLLALIYIAIAGYAVYCYFAVNNMTAEQAIQVQRLYTIVTMCLSNLLLVYLVYLFANSSEKIRKKDKLQEKDKDKEKDMDNSLHNEEQQQ